MYIPAKKGKANGTRELLKDKWVTLPRNQGWCSIRVDPKVSAWFRSMKRHFEMIVEAFSEDGEQLVVNEPSSVTQSADSDVSLYSVT